MTQASPSRPRYGPSVPTFVVGFNPGGRIVIFLRVTDPVYGRPEDDRRPFREREGFGSERAANRSVPTTLVVGFSEPRGRPARYRARP